VGAELSSVGDPVGGEELELVGANDGDTVGDPVGDPVVGEEELEFVGTKDGDPVGDAVGDPVVGEEELELVGDPLGDPVGDTVGELVVGAELAIGATVGASLSWALPTEIAASNATNKRVRSSMMLNVSTILRILRTVSGTSLSSR